MKLFWAKGYASTTLPDLLEAMGIARSSFYASFCDKRTVFVECLQLFGRRTLASIDRDPADSCPTSLIREFFESTLFEAPRHRVQMGCMMVNSVLELADVDAELRQLAEDELDAVERAFECVFTLAMERGSFTSKHSAKELASYVMTINQGLRVQSRKHASPKQLRSIVDTSLKLIGIPA